MRAIPAFGEPQNRSSVPVSGCIKLLYMSHLALGDYIYQGPFLKALTSRYPNIKLDIWIDDCRSKKKTWHAGRNHSLTQWLSSEPHINHIYPITSDKAAFDEQIQQAHQEDYDAIVYVATSRISEFAKTALKIVNQGKVFGTISSNRLDHLLNYFVYKRLDGKLTHKGPATYDHITDFYQAVFKQFFALNVDHDRRLHELNISPQLQKQCSEKLEAWNKKHQLTNAKVIFINHLSTSKKRDWKLSQLEELILLIGNQFPKSLFILNSPPNEFQSLERWAKNNPKINNVAIEIFTARTNFFELPSMMLLCNLVISVETAIMHLASSLNIKQIALIRQSATHWRPLKNSAVLQGKKRVDSIEPREVFNATINL